MEASPLPEPSTSLPGVPDQRILVLVDTFVTNTMAVLNNFAIDCEQKLMAMQSKLKIIDTKVLFIESQLANKQLMVNQPTIAGGG